MRTLPTGDFVPHSTGLAAGGSERSIRRIAGALLVTVGLVLGLLGSGLASSSAGAQQTGTSGTTVPRSNREGGGDDRAGVASVVSVNGVIDPVLLDFMNRSLEEAAAANVVALVFQTDLSGVAISDEELIALVTKMHTSPVPVYLWVGTTGSELTGSAALLLFGAQQVSMAPGTQIGNLPGRLAGPAAGLRPGLPIQPLLGTPIDAKQAEDAKIAGFAPTILEFLVGLPGFQIKEVTDAKTGQVRREPITLVVFSQLPLFSSFMHTAASPAVAYLLLAVGLSLLIFELFTAGVGVAGIIGAGAFVLACYGLAVLPVRPWAIALIVLGMLGLAIDVQTGVPRFWTAAGLVLFAVGTLFLYDGVAMSWITMLVGIGAVALAFLGGMPSMVRTRFSTPTIGREWMIGELGRAMTDISPDGVVQIQGAPWRAYTNRATPIEQLDRVRVIGIEGLVLEVEPEEGAARDYRERGPKDVKAAKVTDGDLLGP